MSKVIIRNSYSMGIDTEVELPCKMEDIKEWSVKWGTFHYTMDGENWKEIELNEDYSIIDTKYPDDTEIEEEEED